METDLENGKAASIDEFWNSSCSLPYGLQVDEVKKAVEDIYNFFYKINLLTTKEGLGYFEHLILGNTLSGMLSELIVKRIAAHSQTLERNIKVGGHPDLLPKGVYENASVLRGEKGIEIKTSVQAGGWQGHNPEKCWLMVFRYIKAPIETTSYFPIQFVEILAAKLEVDDWSLAERGAESRRTRTTSINIKGMQKLRGNFLYRNPDYVVGR